MRGFVRFAMMAAVCAVLAPAAANAQGSITGVVKDTSGAVLPGVTVEAASPALIEKARSVVTDGTGQYRIENLRPAKASSSGSRPAFCPRASPSSRSSSISRQGDEIKGRRHD